MKKDNSLLHEVDKLKHLAELKYLVKRTGIFSGLSLAPLKNLGSWDVHYLGNPITPSGPIQSFHLGNPLPPWTLNLPHGPCNYFAAKALNPSTHHLANIEY